MLLGLGLAVSVAAADTYFHDFVFVFVSFIANIQAANMKDTAGKSDRFGLAVSGAAADCECSPGIRGKLIPSWSW